MVTPKNPPADNTPEAPENETDAAAADATPTERLDETAPPAETPRPADAQASLAGRDTRFPWLTRPVAIVAGAVVLGVVLFGTGFAVGTVTHDGSREFASSVQGGPRGDAGRSGGQSEGSLPGSQPNGTDSEGTPATPPEGGTAPQQGTAPQHGPGADERPGRTAGPGADGPSNGAPKPSPTDTAPPTP